MNHSELIFDPEIDDFEHPFHIKVLLTLIIVVILISTHGINHRLFKFLCRPNRRFMDLIVYIQRLVGTIVLNISMVFFAIIICTKNAKFYVGEIGCYIGPYLFYFLVPYAQGHSFFISIFRYVCIIHPEKLTKRNISPQVFQFILSLLSIMII